MAIHHAPTVQTVVAVVLGCVAFLGMQRRASGCDIGFAPNTIRAFTSTSPADGTLDVPVDTGIVLGLEGSGVSFPPIEISDVIMSVQEQGASAPMGGGLVLWNGNAVWVPTALLKPATGYNVEVKAAPFSGSTAQPRTFAFTTGDQKLPPVLASGEPSFSFEIREVSYCKKQGKSEDSCGGGCAEEGSREAVFAVVRGPALSGGLEASGYKLGLEVLDESGSRTLPYGTATGFFPAGGVATLALQLPFDRPAGGICLKARPTDARGAGPALAPKCFPEDAIPREAPPDEGCSCRTARPDTSGRGGLLGGALALLAGARRARRRGGLRAPWQRRVGLPL
jgi:hypothetical protein